MIFWKENNKVVNSFNLCFRSFFWIVFRFGWGFEGDCGRRARADESWYAGRACVHAVGGWVPAGTEDVPRVHRQVLSTGPFQKSMVSTWYAHAGIDHMWQIALQILLSKGPWRVQLAKRIEWVFFSWDGRGSKTEPPEIPRVGERIFRFDYSIII